MYLVGEMKMNMNMRRKEMKMNKKRKEINDAQLSRTRINQKLFDHNKEKIV